MKYPTMRITGAKKFPYCKLHIREIKKPKFTNNSDDQLSLKVFLTVDILPTSIFAGAIEVYDDDNENDNINNNIVVIVVIITIIIFNNICYRK